MATALLGKAWGFNVQECEPCLFEGKVALKMVPLVKTKFSHFLKGEFCSLVTVKDQMIADSQMQEWTPSEHNSNHHFTFIVEKLIRIFGKNIIEPVRQKALAKFPSYSDSQIVSLCTIILLETNPQKIIENVITPLYSMIIYDAIIGNTDRHRENYGFLFSSPLPTLTEFPTFSPLFDNATCLFWNKNDEQVIQTSIKSGLSKYAKNCFSLITIPDKPKINHFELFDSLLNFGANNVISPPIWNRFIETYNKYPVSSLIQPTELWFSAQRRQLIAEYIEVRVQQLDELFRVYTRVE